MSPKSHRVWGFWFGAWGRVWGFGFRVWGLGFGEPRWWWQDEKEKKKEKEKKGFPELKCLSGSGKEELKRRRPLTLKPYYKP